MGKATGIYRHLAAATGAALLVIGTAGAVEDASRTYELSGAEAISLAERFLSEGRLGAAEAIVLALAQEDLSPDIDRTHIDFLAGMIALRQEKVDEATALFEHLLAYDGTLVGARLELATAYMAKGHYRQAERQLRLASAQGPSVDVQRRIGQQMAAIDRRKVIEIEAGASIVPDTNVNTATAQSTIIAGGVEQRLNDDGALRRSGVGVTSDLSISAKRSVRGDLFARVTAMGRLIDQEGVDFDFATYGLRAGPEWRGRRLRGSLSALVSAQSYGGAPYAEAAGLEAQLLSALTRRVSLSASLSVQALDFQQDDRQDGARVALGLGAHRRLTDQIRTGGSLSIDRQTADDPTLSYWRTHFATYVSGALPAKLFVTVSPSVAVREADEGSEFFGGRREDITRSVSVTLSGGPSAIATLKPQLGYHYTDNDSTIAFYSYDRHRVDLGFSRDF
ncbi:hypothetical protein PB2503_04172 [Parvularcula bermudensis HTCC2503]|uniref:Surface lipoprotein assembly modifier C-terminal domain-containing protein n=2 Tax=Parvularcula TaxID=208215 RepID=E0TEM6_PARBH|nr:hypothetical protein PB2503_04172 [Parvularcula bermudensis HTCC2503]